MPRKNMLKEYADLDTFLTNWNKNMKKQAILEELEEHGVLLEELREESCKDMDDFDLICHIAYDKKPLTRSQRVKNVKKRGDYLSKYEGIARNVIQSLLDKYMDDGIGDLESTEILENEPFTKYGNVIKIANEFGGKQGLLAAMKGLQDEIYVEC